MSRELDYWHSTWHSSVVFYMSKTKGEKSDDEVKKAEALFLGKFGDGGGGNSKKSDHGKGGKAKSKEVDMLSSDFLSRLMMDLEMGKERGVMDKDAAVKKIQRWWFRKVRWQSIGFYLRYLARVIGAKLWYEEIAKLNQSQWNIIENNPLVKRIAEKLMQRVMEVSLYGVAGKTKINCGYFLWHLGIYWRIKDARSCFDKPTLIQDNLKSCMEKVKGSWELILMKRYHHHHAATAATAAVNAEGQTFSMKRACKVFLEAMDLFSDTMKTWKGYNNITKRDSDFKMLADLMDEKTEEEADGNAKKKDSKSLEMGNCCKNLSIKYGSECMIRFEQAYYKKKEQAEIRKKALQAETARDAKEWNKNLGVPFEIQKPKGSFLLFTLASDEEYCLGYNASPAISAAVVSTLPIITKSIKEMEIQEQAFEETIRYLDQPYPDQFKGWDILYTYMHGIVGKIETLLEENSGLVENVESVKDMLAQNANLTHIREKMMKRAFQYQAFYDVMTIFAAVLELMFKPGGKREKFSAGWAMLEERHYHQKKDDMNMLLPSSQAAQSMCVLLHFILDQFELIEYDIEDKTLEVLNESVRRNGVGNAFKDMLMNTPAPDEEFYWVAKGVDTYFENFPSSTQSETTLLSLSSAANTGLLLPLASSASMSPTKQEEESEDHQTSSFSVKTYFSSNAILFPLEYSGKGVMKWPSSDERYDDEDDDDDHEPAESAAVKGNGFSPFFYLDFGSDDGLDSDDEKTSAMCVHIMGGLLAKLFLPHDYHKYHRSTPPLIDKNEECHHMILVDLKDIPKTVAIYQGHINHTRVVILYLALAASVQYIIDNYVEEEDEHANDTHDAGGWGMQFTFGESAADFLPTANAAAVKSKASSSAGSKKGAGKKKKGSKRGGNKGEDAAEVEEEPPPLFLTSLDFKKKVAEVLLEGFKRRLSLKYHVPHYVKTYHDKKKEEWKRKGERRSGGGGANAVSAEEDANNNPSLETVLFSIEVNKISELIEKRCYQLNLSDKKKLELKLVLEGCLDPECPLVITM